MMRLKGENVLVIGVSKGLGYALAYFLLREGANVIVNSGNVEKLKEITNALSKYGNVKYVDGRIVDRESARNVIERAYKEFGNLDGLAVLIGGYLEDDVHSLKGLDEMINNHVKYPLYVVSEAVRFMNPGSTIVLVSAIRGIDKALPNQLSYSIAKAGLAKAVEVLATELVKKEIRVVGIAPSWIDGEFEPDRDWKKLRKLGDPKAPPEDFARVIVWLMTEESQWVNGVIIPVDGGARLL
ncbi:MAG: SDR family NAD(P)-dependent oxidoreductase [Candidatus Aramenus sulfurataquae]|uniref:SDR family NAD(P)-dependent oxidoreductase n=4 Tax=Candidatus Aramenus sulfurataquae TaxID=1326980 RepID=A0AAE3FKW1_9CREN|nr:SDR family NAD(P)-dependent oxidoreductase [Candidatus Aramenus sulfurataquae]